MTACEPGGPKTHETERIFSDLLERLHHSWMTGNGPEANNAVCAMSELISSCTSDSTPAILECCAENRYATDNNAYRAERFFLADSLLVDEPLQADGKGPRIAGAVVSVVNHEIPGVHNAFGGTLQRSAMVPGVMLTNVTDLAAGSNPKIDTRQTFVPFIYMSQPCVTVTPAYEATPKPQSAL